uniref:Domain X domain-containing protein n=1 Tax=Placozoa sp. H11 HM-2017 TaxID=2017598 RepID=A0A7I6NAB2_9METZ|nr:hypothetical protein [Placozoa sp. H11 HM-2017]
MVRIFETIYNMEFSPYYYPIYPWNLKNGFSIFSYLSFWKKTRWLLKGDIGMSKKKGPWGALLKKKINDQQFEDFFWKTLKAEHRILKLQKEGGKKNMRVFDIFHAAFFPFFYELDVVLKKKVIKTPSFPKPKLEKSGIYFFRYANTFLIGIRTRSKRSVLDLQNTIRFLLEESFNLKLNLEIIDAKKEKTLFLGVILKSKGGSFGFIKQRNQPQKRPPFLRTLWGAPPLSSAAAAGEEHPPRLQKVWGGPPFWGSMGDSRPATAGGAGGLPIHRVPGPLAPRSGIKTLVPLKRMVEKLEKQGMCKTFGSLEKRKIIPLRKTPWINLKLSIIKKKYEDLWKEIKKEYAGWGGIPSSSASSASALNLVQHIIQHSAACTIMNKMKISSRKKVFKKYKKELPGYGGRKNPLPFKRIKNKTSLRVQDFI